MMKLESPEFAKIIYQSAVFRGQRKFKDAIELVEKNLSAMCSDCLLNAYMECFYAALEAGLVSKTDEYARKLAAIDPDIPTVKNYLKR